VTEYIEVDVCLCFTLLLSLLTVTIRLTVLQHAVNVVTDTDDKERAGERPAAQDRVMGSLSTQVQA